MLCSNLIVSHTHTQTVIFKLSFCINRYFSIHISVYHYDVSNLTLINAVFIKYFSVKDWVLIPEAPTPHYFLTRLREVDKGAGKHNAKYSGDYLLGFAATHLSDIRDPHQTWRIVSYHQGVQERLPKTTVSIHWKSVAGSPLMLGYAARSIKKKWLLIIISH